MADRLAFSISRERYEEKRRLRQTGLGKALEETAALRTALLRTRDALRLLQPALNTMARDCLDDIIADNIDAALSRQSPPLKDDE